MSQNWEKLSKRSKNRQKCRKTLKKPPIIQQPGKNGQKYRKSLKMTKNAEKTVKNVKKTGEKNQKCAKTG